MKPTIFSPARRAAKVFDEIREDKKIPKKPDVILLANSVGPHCDNSLFYLTGFAEGLFENSYMFASDDGSLSLLTSEMEKLIAAPKARGITISTRTHGSLGVDLKKLAGTSPKTIGLNYSELTVESFQVIKSAFKTSRFVDVSGPLKRARLIKDETEIELIQRACDISSRVYEEIASIIDREGITESEVAAAMGFEAQKMGGGSVPFDTIVAFGKNSAVPHHFAGPDRLRRDDLVLLDYGAKCDRYCSDVTRTLVFGRSSRTQRDMYDVVREANELGIDSCVASNTGEEINSKIGSFLKSKGYRILHGYGHSIGLSVHDGHGLDNNPDHLKPGMVITVEPAVYLPKLGGVRIEDDILITNGKPRILTSASREFTEL